MRRESDCPAFCSLFVLVDEIEAAGQISRSDVEGIRQNRLAALVCIHGIEVLKQMKSCAMTFNTGNLTGLAALLTKMRTVRTGASPLPAKKG
ncbi:hypothetical protein J8I29_06775 [Labrys sp. LIt4]|uniref:hypothetical protein n=1 Tax=Labrys sp. LIt4 TaxID=2821355 RepID=UPI001AE05779|nr:hypothetical protein [Labrys sp. LIt4]MBP0579001.1 hypothetical protein [Labrys sp. LIt4]